MAETPGNQGNTGGNGQQAPSEEAPSEEAAARLAPPATALTITRQYIKDLSFENPNAPDIFKDALEAPELRINVDCRRISVLIFRAPTNRLRDLEASVPAALFALQVIQPGAIVRTPQV